MTSLVRFTHTVTERFLRYAVIDTQSDPDSPTCPSTAKQKNLGALLARELQEMGRAAGFAEGTVQPLPPSPQTMIVFR